MLNKILSTLPEGYTLYGMGPLLSTAHVNDSVRLYDDLRLSWDDHPSYNGSSRYIYAIKQGTPTAYANGIYPQPFGGAMPADHVCVGFGPHSYQQRNTSGNGWMWSVIYTKYTNAGISRTNDATYMHCLYAVPVSVARQHFGFSEIEIASSIPEHTGPVGLDNEEDFPEPLREWARNNQLNTTDTTMPTTTDTNTITPSQLTLEVCKQYVCNDGSIVTIDLDDSSTPFPFRGRLSNDDTLWYTANGIIAGGFAHTSRSILRPVDAPVPAPLVIEVGKQYLLRNGTRVTVTTNDGSSVPFMAVWRDAGRPRNRWFLADGTAHACGDRQWDIVSLAPEHNLVPLSDRPALSTEPQQGIRYLRRDGTISNPLSPDGTRVQDPTTRMVFGETGSCFHTSESPSDLIEPFRIQIGASYVRRDGYTITMTSMNESTGATYPFMAGNISYTPDGVYDLASPNGPMDIVALAGAGSNASVNPALTPTSTAAAAPLTLENGMCYMRRNGTVSGRMWRYANTSTHGSQSEFYDEAYNTTYAANGSYRRGSTDSIDLVSLADPQPAAPTTLPCEEGKVYIDILGRTVGPLTKQEDGTWATDCYPEVRYQESGIPVSTDHMGCMLVGYASEHETQRRLRIHSVRGAYYIVNGLKLGLPSAPEGFDGWYILGRAVTGSHTKPWIYLNTQDNWGSIKFGAVKSGERGVYAEAYKLPPANPTTVTERKEAASYKAYDKFWSRYGNECETGSLFMSVYKFLNDRGIPDAIHFNDEEALVLTHENGYYKCEQIRYGKLWQRTNPDGTDDQRRDFTNALDRVIKGVSNVEIEWSSVEDTYCTPMAGWESDEDTVTGSCMEKFCNDDDCGHAVFQIYKDVERNGNLKMIRILIDGDYVGRTICWKPTADHNGWIMDRVYCRAERGSIPNGVFMALAAFAAENDILGRTAKCKVNKLPEVALADIALSGATDYDFYPYFDTYSGVRYDRIVMNNASITCDCADGNSQEERGPRHVPMGHSGDYPEEDLSWSDREDEWIHEDDAVTTWDGEIIHSDNSVELGYNSGEYAHADDCTEVMIYVNGSRRTVYGVTQ